MKRFIITLLITFSFGLSNATDSLTNNKLNYFISEWYQTPYKFGGESKAGIDCSAFTQLLYKNVFDFDLPRTCKEQITKIVKITKDQLETGSLIFFKIGKNQWHVGVYLMNGLFVHSSVHNGVFISNLESDYWSRYIYKFGKIIQ